MSATWHIGDTRTVLRTLPDASVDLALTSSPFYGLRSYLPNGHIDKPLEMGSEASPAEFLDGMLDVVEELRRVLAPHGSMAWELGDTYAGSGGAGGDYGDEGLRAGQPKFKQGKADVPLDKSLMLIPESFRWALAYGRNPFTGRTIEPWRVRNVVRWCRPNPPVGALADKFRPATSDMVIACMSRSRYFDLDAVRTEHKYPDDDRSERPSVKTPDRDGRLGAVLSNGGNPAGAPPLDWWRIPTQPYRGSHYATWPEDLCITPILAMCPQKVCTVCGKPSRRIVERSERYATAREAIGDFNERGRDGDGVSGSRSVLSKAAGADMTCAENITVGWSDCEHNAWRPGIVLDCFAGSGTTGAVAIGHGRSFIGIDLDERNYHLARERIGMWLTEAPTNVADVATGGLL